MKSFFKRFSLPVSLLVGVVSYLMFSQIEILEPIGDVAGPLFLDIMPVVLFTILYVTFCKIQIKEMKPRTWHFILQGIRIALSGFFVWLITLASDADTKLVLEGMFICIICPTAAAAPVVTEKLGGSIGSLTIYTIIANVVTSVIILPNGGEKCRHRVLCCGAHGAEKRDRCARGAFGIGTYKQKGDSIVHFLACKKERPGLLSLVCQSCHSVGSDNAQYPSLYGVRPYFGLAYHTSSFCHHRSFCHRQGRGTPVWRQHKCWTGFGTEKHRRGHLADHLLPQPACRSGSRCLCAMAEHGERLAVVV